MSRTWNYFTDEEVANLNEEFVAKLDQARHVAGIPFIITSGFRTPEKNKSIIGSVPDSSHCKGLAVDLRVSSAHEVWQVQDGARAAQIFRVGIYVDKHFKPVHMHLDVDPDKPQHVLFIKQEASYV